MNKSAVSTIVSVAAGLYAFAASAGSAFDTQLATIQEQWAVANYQTPAGDQRRRALETLSEQAHQFALANPQRAEPLIWEGIVLSTYAGAKGGLGALGIAKKSRASLEAALKIDPNALQGSAFTSLGALYSKVPGFPLGFGDDDKAKAMLQRALTIDPDGIDSNYFYAQYLCDRDQCAQAVPYLERAARAKPREGRQLADAGRQQEILELMQKAQRS
jgi:tetratricopeptide (TPR) repeat protein